jgi:predicted MFS family arabinose efflux permease
LAAAGTLVSVRSLVAMGAPLFGVLADRLEERRVMLVGVALLVAGAALTAGLPGFFVALLGFGLMGLAKSAYDPAMQVYIGRRVSYERRGWAIAITELSWSATWLGMPFAGWLIDRVSWRAPFVAIAALGLVGWQLTRRMLPIDQHAELDNSNKLGFSSEGVQRNMAQAGQLQRFSHLWRDRQAWLAMSIAALIILAQDSIMIVYGAWMEDAFGLTVTALGGVSLVIGAAELVAELGAAVLSDRLGKRRAVLIGLIAMAGGYLLMPRLSGTLIVALAGMAFVVLAFEFSIVSFIPLVSGLNAAARGTLMSLIMTAHFAGRVVAAPLAVALYRPGDLTRNGLLAATVCVLLLGLLALLRERRY